MGTQQTFAFPERSPRFQSSCLELLNTLPVNYDADNRKDGNSRQNRNQHNKNLRLTKHTQKRSVAPTNAV
ncbi:hypothetical protein HNV12_11310 [Methanococcoides sp. SA1]|nr:hypothetical protein [Methanococcoides sp. SA1]